MLKHTIDSRKGWWFDVEEKPEYVYSVNAPYRAMVNKDVRVRAVNKYTGKSMTMFNPLNWKITRVFDPDTYEFKYATFSWESE